MAYNTGMIYNILIFVVVVILITVYLKKFTVYRCPKCQSRNINKVDGKLDENGKQIYYCQECREEISR